MKRFALIAAVAALFATPAVAGDIGGGVAGVNMQSFSGGAIGGGNVGVAGLVGPSSINSTFTQSAHNDGIAGTTATLTKLPNGMQAQIVSEHALNGWTSQSVVGSANGLAGQVNLGGAVQGGVALSGGNMQGIIGYLNW